MVLAGYLCFLEVAAVTALAVAISTRLPFGPTLVLCVALFVLGHLANHLVGLFAPEGGQLQVEQAGFLAAAWRWPAYGVARVLAALLPNLENFNVSGGLNTGRAIPYTYVLGASAYALLYCGAALSIGAAALENREYP